MPPPPPTTEPPTAPRTRPLTQQIQIIRELWLLREQARVQAAERRFLTELERLLSGTHVTSPRPPAPHQTTSPHAAAAPPPPPPPLPDDLRPASLPSQPLFAPGPVRERLRAFEGEVQQLREQQHVTNLTPHFRALLEGNPPTPPPHLTRSRSIGELTSTRAVTNALESEFRHHLETILTRRDRTHATNTRHLYQTIPLSPTTPTQSPPSPDADPTALQSVVRALRDEVTVLKNVISASFDLQLDIQRSIRQEVAAAICTPARVTVGRPVAIADTSACTVDSAVGDTVSSGEEGLVPCPRQNVRASPVQGGCCVVCLEASIDSLLYACGHMCTCCMCGRQLVASGQSCPICRAPVRDVVRAFMVAE